MFLFQVQAQRKTAQQLYREQLDAFAKQLPKNPDNVIRDMAAANKMAEPFIKFMCDCQRDLTYGQMANMLSDWSKNDPTLLYRWNHVVAAAAATEVTRSPSAQPANSWLGLNDKGKVMYQNAKKQPWPGLVDEADRLAVIQFHVLASDQALLGTKATKSTQPWLDKSLDSFTDLKLAADNWHRNDEAKVLITRFIESLQRTYLGQSSNASTADELLRQTGNMSTNQMVPHLSKVEAMPLYIPKGIVGSKFSNTTETTKIETFTFQVEDGFLKYIRGTAKSEVDANLMKVVDFIAKVKLGTPFSPQEALDAFNAIKNDDLIRDEADWAVKALNDYNHDLNALWSEFSRLFLQGNLSQAFGMIESDSYFKRLFVNAQQTKKVKGNYDIETRIPRATYEIGATIGWNLLTGKQQNRAIQTREFIESYSGPELHIITGLSFKGTYMDVERYAHESLDGAILPNTVQNEKWSESTGVVNIPFSLEAYNISPAKNLFLDATATVNSQIGGYRISNRGGKGNTFGNFPQKFSDFTRNIEGNTTFQANYELGKDWRTHGSYVGQFSGNFNPYHFTSLGVQYVNRTFGLLDLRYDQPIGSKDKTGRMAILFSRDCDLLIIKQLNASAQASPKGLHNVSLGTSIDIGIPIYLSARYYPNLEKYGTGTGKNLEFSASIFPSSIRF